MNFFKRLIKSKPGREKNFFFIDDLYRYAYKNLTMQRLKVNTISYVTLRDMGIYYAIETYENVYEPRTLLHTIYISRDADDWFADANGMRYHPKTTGGYLDQKCLMYFQKTHTAIKNTTPNTSKKLIF